MDEDILISEKSVAKGFILVDKRETKRLIGVFQNEFCWITHSTGHEQSYLGMIV
jgi:hypothetical protein